MGKAGYPSWLVFYFYTFSSWFFFFSCVGKDFLELCLKKPKFHIQPYSYFTKGPWARDYIHLLGGIGTIHVKSGSPLGPRQKESCDSKDGNMSSVGQRQTLSQLEPLGSKRGALCSRDGHGISTHMQVLM